MNSEDAGAPGTDQPKIDAIVERVGTARVAQVTRAVVSMALAAGVAIVLALLFTR